MIISANTLSFVSKIIHRDVSGCLCFVLELYCRHLNHVNTDVMYVLKQIISINMKLRLLFDEWEESIGESQWLIIHCMESKWAIKIHSKIIEQWTKCLLLFDMYARYFDNNINCTVENIYPEHIVSNKLSTYSIYISICLNVCDNFVENLFDYSICLGLTYLPLLFVHFLLKA